MKIEENRSFGELKPGEIKQSDPEKPFLEESIVERAVRNASEINNIYDFLRTNGWLYFGISFIPGISGFLLSDQPFTWRTTVGVILASFVNGLIAIKAYRSTGRADELIFHNEKLNRLNPIVKRK